MGGDLIKERHISLPALDMAGEGSLDGQWTVIVKNQKGSVNFSYPAGASDFLLSLDDEGLYAISAHYSECAYCEETDGGCDNCEVDCVCGGMIYPYDKKLSRVHGFSASVLSFYLDEMGESYDDSQVLLSGRKFNWKKLLTAIDDYQSLYGADYPYNALSSLTVAKKITSGGFSVTALKWSGGGDK